MVPPSRPLVLASASPARLRLLQQAGFEPTVVVSGVDEEAITAGTTAELVQRLAEAKADAVVGRAEVPADALVIGCDSLFELDGRAHGKPSSAEDALARWRRMRGNEGTLHTGHCLLDTRTGRRVTDVASTVVRFADPSDAELAAYVASGEPLHVAGAFTLDGRSAPFVERIDGDHGNVIGLSLPLLRRLLLALDVEVTSLWA